MVLVFAFLLGFLRGVEQKQVEKARFLDGISRSFGGHKAVLMRTFFTAEKFATFSTLFFGDSQIGKPSLVPA
jgi:hypothetical protein